MVSLSKQTAGTIPLRRKRSNNKTAWQLTSITKIFYLILAGVVLVQFKAFNSAVIPKEVLSPTLSPTDSAIMYQQQQQQQQQQKRNSNNKYNICPHINTIIHNTSTIEVALDRAHHFHNRGGALQTMIAYQDDNMKQLFRHYNLTFDQKESGTLLAGTDALDFIQKYFAERSNPRGGYFSSLPGHFLNHTSSINRNHIDFEDKKIKTVHEPNSKERWIAGMGPIGPACDSLLELGTGFEAKYMCLPPGGAIQNKNDDCHILSIGSNDQWNFEKAVIHELKHCHVHTFDCTLLNNTAKRKPKNGHVHFYPYCIGATSRIDPATDREYLTYTDLWKKTGATSPPKLAKMDVEGFEYDVIPQFLLSTDPSLLPEQFMVELHFMTRMWAISWMLRSLTAAEIMLLMGVFFRQGGYIPAYTFHDPGCKSCMETLFIRAQC